MWFVILETESEGLSNFLLLVLVVKENFALWRESLDAKRKVSSRVLILSILWFEVVLIGELLFDFDKLNLVWLDFLSNKHFVISEFCQIIGEMDLLEDIRDNIHKLKLALIPNLRSVVLVWQLESSQLIVLFIRLVVNNCNEFKFLVVTVSTHWTLQNGVI